MLGKFKNKDKSCNNCGSYWTAHEEKETDFNIGIKILDCAYQDTFDKAIIISADSDFSPAIRLTRKRFPNKKFKILTPINRNHSFELMNAVGGSKNAKKMKLITIQRSQFPNQISLDSGQIIHIPEKYKTK